MSTQEIIIVLILGALAGWLAGLIFEGSGLGLLGNIIVGILGGMIGYWLLPRLGIRINTGYAWLNVVLTSAIGGVVLLMLLNLLFGSRRT